MKRLHSGRSFRTLVILLAVSVGLRTVGAQVYAPGARYPSTKDDAEFMQGMIMHHAQAIIMANWAPSHGASQTVQVLCARIALSQTNDIKLMQEWLRVRKFVVPDSTGKMPKDDMAGMAGMSGMSGMAGMSSSDTAPMMMPGMLTPDQMKLLDNARGPEFDRLFLTFMIQHHNGALIMVDKLFSSPAGGQDDDIFKFATAVHADQSAEIDRMKGMLAAARPPAPHSRH
ncbi:MAG TPA: DUF305 domain-containing protein [Gemmatimonadaceae bacterium]|nr:DUF305 domain-containing protein [Gemmatimonadaceae bacterium]